MPHPPFRRRWQLLISLAVLAVLGLSGCGDDDPTTALADARADQARRAAVHAGLDDEVADFLALAARGAAATYQVTYPGPRPGTELVIANRPPDRRIDVVDGGEVREVRLVLAGEAFSCARPAGSEDFAPCERVDAIADPLGRFGDGAIDKLTEALRAGATDFALEIETRAIAGVEATCLVTRILAGHETPELGEGSSLCVSPEGALLLVDQDDERLEATDYGTEVADGTFERPDGGARAG